MPLVKETMRVPLQTRMEVKSLGSERSVFNVWWPTKPFRWELKILDGSAPVHRVLMIIYTIELDRIVVGVWKWWWNGSAHAH